MPEKLVCISSITAQCDKCGNQNKTLYKCYKRSLKKYNGKYLCYRCSISSPEYRAKQRENGKKSTPRTGPLSELTKSRLSIIMKSKMTPERRAEISVRSKKLWERSDFRIKVGNKLSKYWLNPEIKAKAMTKIIEKSKDTALKIKELWKNHDYRSKITKILSKARQITIDRLASDPIYLSMWRQRCSNICQRLYAEGKLRPRNYGIKMKTIKGGIFRTRSTYETTYAQMLDNNKRVLYFTYEPFQIKYEYEGIIRGYTPDFLVVYNDRIELVEIKPKKLLNIGTNPTKFRSCEEYCVISGLKFVIVTEDELTT